jgi:hypothetical protein
MKPRKTRKHEEDHFLAVLTMAVCVLQAGSSATAQQSSPEKEARAPIEAFFKAFNARDNEG